MEIENSPLPARLEETGRVYLTPGPASSNAMAAGVWKVAIRNGEGIRRAIVTARALRDWGSRQAPVVQERIDDLILRFAERRTRTPRIDLSVPVVMGIINATPDSFSDGGAHEDAAGAVEHGRRLADAGARILDIGGESTRPGANPVTPEEEISRVLPVIQGLQDLRRQTSCIALSIDTRHASVMRAALGAGVDMINDVSALTNDPESLSIAAGSDADIVLMHMQGDPRTMNRAPSYADVSLDVFDYLEARINACVAAGIDRQRLIVDPGIGFGKRGPENLTILREIGLFRGLGCPVLLGASRKGFGDHTQALAPRGRLPTSLAAATVAVFQGVQIFRVHDVAETRQALDICRKVALAAASSAADLV
jgi:dihydropteroate synthase